LAHKLGMAYGHLTLSDRPIDFGEIAVSETADEASTSNFV